MTPESFGELLRRPALLSGYTATELEELIARFPWCGPLRKLRYEKAVLEGDDAAVRLWRARAAPYLAGIAVETRTARLRQANPARAEVHFDFEAPYETAGVTSVAISTAAVATAMAPPTPAAVHRGGSEVAGPGIALGPILGDVLASAETVDWYLQRHDLIMDQGRPKPAPKESFDSYRAYRERRAETAWSDLLQLGERKRKPPRNKRRKPRGSEAAAHAAVPEVASETLADLLAAQGRREQAIRMYKQLALRYPEKSATFARRIASLEQDEPS